MYVITNSYIGFCNHIWSLHCVSPVFIFYISFKSSATIKLVGLALDFVRPCYYIAYNLLNIYNLLRVRQRMNKEKRTLPLLALRDVIIFPSTIAPVFIGREKSLNALLSAKKIEDVQHILLMVNTNLARSTNKVFNCLTQLSQLNLILTEKK